MFSDIFKRFGNDLPWITQKIVNIFLDCDNDTLLFKVIQDGVACHTGRKSCFFKNLEISEVVDLRD